MLDGFLSSHADVAGIGFAGQMHGILYLDRAGRLLGPLFTWQDGRGDLPDARGVSTAARLSAALGRRVSTGMGLVTHAYNLAHGLVPKETAWLCTIMDYVAMTAAGARAPLMDPTNAASLGGFDVGRLDFRRDILETLGVDAAVFPRVPSGYPAIGEARRGAPVFTAAGDNQASFLGSVRETASTVLLNVGTSSQVSVRVDSATDVAGIDIRPFPFGGYLAVGAALSGGSAYALLRRFFERTLKLFTAEAREVSWDTMNAVPGGPWLSGLGPRPAAGGHALQRHEGGPRGAGAHLADRDRQLHPGAAHRGHERGNRVGAVGVLRPHARGPARAGLRAGGVRQRPAAQSRAARGLRTTARPAHAHARAHGKRHRSAPR